MIKPKLLSFFERLLHIPVIKHATQHCSTMWSTSTDPAIRPLYYVLPALEQSSNIHSLFMYKQVDT